jgi:hypothetical protein
VSTSISNPDINSFKIFNHFCFLESRFREHNSLPVLWRVLRRKGLVRVLLWSEHVLRWTAGLLSSEQWTVLQCINFKLISLFIRYKSNFLFNLQIIVRRLGLQLRLHTTRFCQFMLLPNGSCVQQRPRQRIIFATFLFTLLKTFTIILEIAEI